MTNYKANGKFLLTGEYLVLKGALALALPLKLGQSLEVQTLETDENRLLWKASQPEGHWFSVLLSKTDIQVIDSDDDAKASKLAELLKAVKSLNGNAFNGNDLQFETHLDFNPEWGLGSSSTLIANLAQWANVNPYALLKLTFGGSGYDIACASARRPIFYQIVNGKPVTQAVDFNPTFADKLFFVYQGKKQSSAKEVGKFQNRVVQIDMQDDMDAVSEISRSLVSCTDFNAFCTFLQIHEDIIAHCIGREPLKTHFPDFQGTIKSLGAWGGDFFLAATEWNESQVRDYFGQKGLDVVFNFADLSEIQ